MKQIAKVLLIILLSTLTLQAAIQRVTTNYIQIIEDGTYIGNSLNQTYSIDPTAISNGSSITIIDQKGNNTIELVGGLTITSSQVVSDELILTLSNATTINVRGADTFTYDVGANSASGTTGTQQNFSTFVTSTLGLASVLTQAVVSGGSVGAIVDGGVLNVPPVANAGVDQTVLLGDSVILDAVGSTDSDGSIVSYEWKDGDIVLSTNSTFTKSDFTEGDHYITLSVTDDDGAVNSDTVLVRVSATGEAGGTIDKPKTISDNEYNHNILLRVVRVTPDWMSYSDISGWDTAAPFKVNSSMRYFDIAIWEEKHSIELYEFPNSYSDNMGNYIDKSDSEKIAYREQFLIKKFTGMPSDYFNKSTFIKNSFIDIAKIISLKYPNSGHALIYNGHGGPGGKLFEGMLSYNDSNEFLKAWTDDIGHQLSFIDMGGPCSKGSFSDLKNFCQYSKYYIASDTSNGGYQMDNYSYEKMVETNPDYQYPKLFENNSNLKDVLKSIIDRKRKRYEYSRINISNNKVKQANYLYSCANFLDFSKPFKTFLDNSNAYYTIFDDLYKYMENNNATDSLFKKFDDIIIYGADTKDFFQWDSELNGLTMPDPNL